MPEMGALKEVLSVEFYGNLLSLVNRLKKLLIAANCFSKNLIEPGDQKLDL